MYATRPVHSLPCDALTCTNDRRSTGVPQPSGTYPQVVRPVAPQPVHDSLQPGMHRTGSTRVKYWVQLTLFDASAYLVRRFRRSSADNATKRRQGRLILAGGLIVDDRGRILLLHRSTPALTWWETPGGKVDPGEQPRDAAIRELSEELGIVSSVVVDLGWHDFESARRPMRYALYQMRIDHGHPRPVETDRFDAVAFFTWTQLLGMRDQLSPNARNVLDMYTRGRLQLADSV